MRIGFVVIAFVFVGLLLPWSSTGASLSIKVNNGGDGRYICSSGFFSPDTGVFEVVTTMKNYCGKKFAGSVFTVALSADGEIIYASEPEHFDVAGATLAGKAQNETYAWNKTIPRRYLGKVAKIAIIHLTTPVNRLWTWIYQNKQLIRSQAVAISVPAEVSPARSI